MSCILKHQHNEILNTFILSAMHRNVVIALAVKVVSTFYSIMHSIPRNILSDNECTKLSGYRY